MNIPHRSAHGLCPINGIRDLIQWRTGHDWSNELVFGLALGGGFAYLRFNFADPPRQVYWGNASPRQHKYLAELFNAAYSELENRSFKYAWGKARETLAAGIPPIIGPLDMFYLPFYTGIYHQRHIPIHYLLLVGCDDENAYVHDTGSDDVEVLPLAELESAWDVNVPGMGKRNRLVIVNIPEQITSPEVLIRKSITDECKLMLEPPVSMLGIPAMQKLSREIAQWPQELGNLAAEKCLLQVREYLNTPPDLTGDHLTAGRDIYIVFLEQAQTLTGLDFSLSISRFRNSIDILPKLTLAIQNMDLSQAAACFGLIAENESVAFSILLDCVQESG